MAGAGCASCRSNVARGRGCVPRAQCGRRHTHCCAWTAEAMPTHVLAVPTLLDRRTAHNHSAQRDQQDNRHGLAHTAFCGRSLTLRDAADARMRCSSIHTHMHTTVMTIVHACRTLCCCCGGQAHPVSHTHAHTRTHTRTRVRVSDGAAACARSRQTVLRPVSRPCAAAALQLCHNNTGSVLQPSSVHHCLAPTTKMPGRQAGSASLTRHIWGGGGCTAQHARVRAPTNAAATAAAVSSACLPCGGALP
jgi:hypothetical protein